MEFTNPKQHVGWQGGKPVFVVFSLDLAEKLFNEFKQSGVVALCVAVPKAARAETFEQAVSFFSDDHVAAVVKDSIFAIA